MKLIPNQRKDLPELDMAIKICPYCSGLMLECNMLNKNFWECEDCEEMEPVAGIQDGMS